MLEFSVPKSVLSTVGQPMNDPSLYRLTRINLITFTSNFPHTCAEL